MNWEVMEIKALEWDVRQDHTCSYIGMMQFYCRLRNVMCKRLLLHPIRAIPGSNCSVQPVAVTAQNGYDSQWNRSLTRACFGACNTNLVACPVALLLVHMSCHPLLCIDLLCFIKFQQGWSRKCLLFEGRRYTVRHSEKVPHLLYVRLPWGFPYKNQIKLFLLLSGATSQPRIVS